MRSDSALDAWLEPAEALLAAPAPTTVYDEAADLIERFGWRQRSYGDPAIGFCLLGALLLVSEGRVGGQKTHWWFREASRWADELGVPSCGGSGLASLVRWNDQPDRTVDEVLDRLRAAAKQEAQP